MANGAPGASALVSLAIVKVNWDKSAKSYADSFTPFVAVALDACGQSSPVSCVRDRVSRDFGILLPQNVVLNLLERARRSGLAKAEGRRLFSPTESASALHAVVDEQRTRLARRRNRLVEIFLADAAEVGTTVSSDDAERILLHFIELHSAPLLAGILRGDLSGVRAPESEREEFLAARFIIRVLEREPEVSEYLADVVKGSMLAASLYSTTPGEVERKFRATTLFLDTPLLLKALGHEGERAAVPVLEMVALARDSAAEIACFEHSLHEIEGVLHGVADVLASGRRPPAVRGVLSHYLAVGASSSDVLERLTSVERELRDVHVGIVQRPPHEREVTIDELALRAALTDDVHYSNDAALDHDIESLTAVHRLRRGKRVEQIERAGAVLVTDNAGLVATALRFFRSNEGASVGPAVLDHNITTLLWAKASQGAPDLPLNQILADAYALLDPGPAMWRAYMNQIDQLARRGEVSPGDVTELRFSMEAHRAVVTGTGGDSARLTKSVVMNALEASRLAASEPERAARRAAEGEAQGQRDRVTTLATDVQRASGEAENLRAAVSRLEARAEAQLRSIENQGRREVRRWLRVGLVATTVLGVACILAPQIGALPHGLASALSAGGWVLATCSAITQVFGGSLKAVTDRFEEPLVQRRIQHLQSRLHLVGDAHDVLAAGHSARAEAARGQQ